MLMAAGATAVVLPGAVATAAPATPVPLVKLVALDKVVKVPKFGRFTFVDPGVFVETFGSPLRFDVGRASYSKPITITQIIRTPSGLVRRPLPHWAAQGWQGLRRFLRLTITNTAGKVVGSRVTPFCPDSFNPQRTSPNSPQNSPYPANGCFTNPFEVGMVWGLQQGWGVDPVGGGFGPFGGDVFRLRLGTYHVRENITLMWRRILHISLARGSATVTIHVVKGSQCKFVCPALRHRPARPALPELPSSVPTLASPPLSTRPDLVPLPSYGISVQNHRARTTHPASSFMSFGATVWIGGNSPLDVEGFRSPGAPTMQAWQFFFSRGKVVGKTPAGTMGFDTRKGHNHWHFQQFAQYRLLNAHKKLVVRSRKVGFCIAPTDAINMLLPHATWQPNFIGFTGACGSPTALWVRETLPLGWGDTYFQFLAGQSFNISHLPNGTYYIEVIANPLHRLFETNYGNDISLRKVILGGTTAHRTVRVPPFHGIDPEHGGGRF